MANPRSEFDVKLSPRDRVHIFGIETDRAQLVKSVVDKLVAQERANAPAKVVSVVGNVRHPGTYPWHRGMTVQDLLTASFETKADAFADLADAIEATANPALQSLKIGPQQQAIDPAAIAQAMINSAREIAQNMAESALNAEADAALL